MLLDELVSRYPVLAQAVLSIKEHDSITEFFPPQEDAINSGYLDGKNLLLTIPTSCGKLLIAELAAVKMFLESGKKTIYLVPLKALAMEKFGEFKKKYADLGMKVTVSIGDYDSNDKWMADYDIIVTSVEKADSILRRNPSWIKDVGLVVADEVHLLDDVSRGPTLEIVLTKLIETASPQIIGLSATVNNRKELAGWLSATLVESDFRPVKLVEGIAYGNEVVFPRNPLMDYTLSDRKTLESLVSSVTAGGQQSIIFVSSKRSTQAEAERMGRIVRHQLSDSEKNRLEKISVKILSVMSTPTEQCTKLAKVVKMGTAFHNSGLVHKQKEMIEQAYKKGYIKCICATTTLAYGVNLPCDAVIVRDVKRFYGKRGMAYIPVLEYKQCAGRAGRVGYSREGRAVIIGSSKSDVEKYSKKFIDGEMESITSKLGVETALRVHVLSLAASGMVATIEELKAFFEKTFYAYQYGDMSSFFLKIESVIGVLIDFGFVESDSGNIRATSVGRRVSELCIDPVSANMFIEGIRRNVEIVDEDRGFALGRSDVVSDFVSADTLAPVECVEVLPYSLLQIISYSMEMMPRLGVRKSEEEHYDLVFEAVKSNLIVQTPSVWSYEMVGFMDSLKTSMMLKEWIEEATEKELQDRYNVSPGELKVKLDNADWLLFSVAEFSRIYGLEEMYSFVTGLRFRLKYGIRGELMELVKIKGVGRVRARKLFGLGIKGVKDVYTADPLVLAKIVGEKTAQKMLENVGRDASNTLENQKTLGNF